MEPSNDFWLVVLDQLTEISSAIAAYVVTVGEAIDRFIQTFGTWF